MRKKPNMLSLFLRTKNSFQTVFLKVVLLTECLNPNWGRTVQFNFLCCFAAGPEYQFGEPGIRWVLDIFSFFEKKNY